MTLAGSVLLLLLTASPLDPGDGGPRLLSANLQVGDLTAEAGSQDRAADLSLPSGRSPGWVASTEGANGAEGAARPGAAASKADALDFNLLGPPPAAPPADEEKLTLRRKMLTWHQGVGLGMFALQLATTIVGQLSYDDKFGGDNTGKYVQAHAILAYSTLAAFAAAGTLALLAPKPFERQEGFDRVSLHKVAMFTAAAGMLAQGLLGMWTQSREGYLNQQSIARAHLVVGYVTLVAVATGVGALVF